jgi:hypothetical protein
VTVSTVFKKHGGWSDRDNVNKTSNQPPNFDVLFIGRSASKASLPIQNTGKQAI